MRLWKRTPLLFDPADSALAGLPWFLRERVWFWCGFAAPLLVAGSVSWSSWSVLFTQIVRDVRENRRSFAEHAQTEAAMQIAFMQASPPEVVFEFNTPPDPSEEPGQLVDINSASLKELERVPGIGPVTAQKIVASRPYASLDELTKVSGIRERRLSQLRPYLRCDAGR
jgi:DNA uptake protein ComE-like DNA-binding protein